MPKLPAALAKTDWASLAHANGSAFDIPELLVDLHDDRRSSAALDQLFASINHQGDQSEAGLYACPYLLELIKDDDLPNLAQVLSLILGIAIGYPSECLADEERLTARLARLRSTANHNPLQRLELECHAAARHGVDRFLCLMDHREPHVSWHAAYNLAWFPQEASRTLPILRERVSSAESNSEGFANYLLATGLLQWQRGRRRAESTQVARYLESPDRLTRYSAAIYCSWFTINDRVIRVLEELQFDEDFDGCKRERAIVVFHDGDLMQYATKALRRIKTAKNRGE